MKEKTTTRERERERERGESGTGRREEGLAREGGRVEGETKCERRRMKERGMRG